MHSEEGKFLEYLSFVCLAIFIKYFPQERYEQAKNFTLIEDTGPSMLEQHH